MFICRALLILLLSTLSVFAQEPKYKPIELKLSGLISDPDTCERAFAHFAKYCDIFTYLDPKLYPNREPWGNDWGLKYAWFDFDDDDELDLYVLVKAFGACGTLGCSNVIVFHDIATSFNCTFTQL